MINRVGISMLNRVLPWRLIKTINMNTQPASAITQPARVIVELIPALINRDRNRALQDRTRRDRVQKRGSRQARSIP